MHHPSRPPNRPDGAPTIKITSPDRDGGDPAAALAQTSRSDSRESPGGGTDTPDSRAVFRSRQHPPPRRASSGYFSSEGDSVPASPLSPAMTDRGTQTASRTAQLLTHALRRMSEDDRGQHGHPPSTSSMRPPNAAGDMQTEAVGQELRRIGDDFNRLLLTGMADRQRRMANPPVNPVPHIHQEPTMLLCVGLLILLIGRMIYLQGHTGSQDPSQV